jgi:hypothetical protein
VQVPRTNVVPAVGGNQIDQLSSTEMLAANVDNSKTAAYIDCRGLPREPKSGGGEPYRHYGACGTPVFGA